MSKTGFQDFTFGIITDTHIRAPGGDKSSVFPVNEKADGRARYAAELLAAQKPDFTIHLGDMVHPQPHMKAYPPAAKSAHEILEPLKPKLNFVPGNHDIGDKPSLVSPAGPADEKSLNQYSDYFGESFYCFDYNQVLFVVVNSSLVNNSSKQEEVQRNWLEKIIKEAKNQRIFLFSHYPPFINDALEQSHYDNYAEPGRQWLLSLLDSSKIEAVFSGHVHHFFFNIIGETKLYCHPATSFTRQDYSALFSGPPANEYGRDDTSKFGVSLVKVSEKGHELDFLQTHGNTLEQGEKFFEKTRSRPSKLNFLIPHMRHDWAQPKTLPYNGPMEEFSRKVARNDYFLLRLKQLGIKSVRVPISDLENENILKRMGQFRALGISFVIFCVGIPTEKQRQTLKSYSNLIEAFEIVTSNLQILQREEFTELAKDMRILVSKITTSASSVDSSKPFAHTVSCGFLSTELGVVNEWISNFDNSLNIRFVFQIDWGQSPGFLISKWPHSKNKLALNVRLSDTNPAMANFNFKSIKKLLFQLQSMSTEHPSLVIMLDTFADLDRGYHPRTGLINTSSNIHEWLFN